MSAHLTPSVPNEAAPQPGNGSSPHAGHTEESIIFLHLPKTAGTTVNRLIEWEYRLSEMFSIDPVLFEWSAAHLRKLPPGRLRKIRMFKGHMTFGLHEVLPQPATYRVEQPVPGMPGVGLPCFRPIYQFLFTVLHLFREAWPQKFVDFGNDVSLMKFEDVIRLIDQNRNELTDGELLRTMEAHSVLPVT